MNGQYVQIDVTDLQAFNDKLRKAANGDLKKEFALFLEGIGFEMLSYPVFVLPRTFATIF